MWPCVQRWRNSLCLEWNIWLGACGFWISCWNLHWHHPTSIIPVPDLYLFFTIIEVCQWWKGFLDQFLFFFHVCVCTRLATHHHESSFITSFDDPIISDEDSWVNHRISRQFGLCVHIKVHDNDLVHPDKSWKSDLGDLNFIAFWVLARGCQSDAWNSREATYPTRTTPGNNTKTESKQVPQTSINLIEHSDGERKTDQGHSRCTKSSDVRFLWNFNNFLRWQRQAKAETRVLLWLLRNDDA